MRRMLLSVLALGEVFLVGIAKPAYAADAAEGMEPIKIELPEPYFGCSLISYWSEHLEHRNFRDRPPFLAPKGTSLVSRGKPVSSSVKAPIRGNLNMLVDGDKRYGEDSVVALEWGVQWVQIDLTAEYETYAVLLWHFFKGSQVYFSVVVQASNDPEFKTGVTTLFNSDYKNVVHAGEAKDMEYIESFQGRLIDAKGVKARYIRCYSNGNANNEENHYIEIEVFGRPVKRPEDVRL